MTPKAVSSVVPPSKMISVVPGSTTNSVLVAPARSSPDGATGGDGNAVLLTGLAQCVLVYLTGFIVYGNFCIQCTLHRTD